MMNKKAPYENLKFYQQASELRGLIYKTTDRFSARHSKLVSQMRNAARSVKQNIREGYRRVSVLDFKRFLRISQGSLEELIGDLEDCFEDGLLTSEEYAVLSKLAGSVNYLMARYIQSLYKIEEEDTWNIPSRIKKIREASNRLYLVASKI